MKKEPVIKRRPGRPKGDKTTVIRVPVKKLKAIQKILKNKYLIIVTSIKYRRIFVM